MKFIIVVFGLFGGIAFADQSLPMCERHEFLSFCTSFKGEVVTSDGVTFEEVISFVQSQQSINDVEVTVTRTYDNGDQDRRVLLMRFADDEHFDLIKDQNIIGTGLCRMYYCFYDRAATEPEFNFRGLVVLQAVDDGGLYLRRYEEKVDSQKSKISSEEGVLLEDEIP